MTTMPETLVFIKVQSELDSTINISILAVHKAELTRNNGDRKLPHSGIISFDPRATPREKRANKLNGLPRVVDKLMTQCKSQARMKSFAKLLEKFLRRQSGLTCVLHPKERLSELKVLQNELSRVEEPLEHMMDGNLMLCLVDWRLTSEYDPGYSSLHECSPETLTFSKIEIYEQYLNKPIPVEITAEEENVCFLGVTCEVILYNSFKLKLQPVSITNLTNDTFHSICFSGNYPASSLLSTQPSTSVSSGFPPSFQSSGFASSSSSFCSTSSFSTSEVSLPSSALHGEDDSFIFYHIETTNLKPCKITEICMIATNKDNLVTASQDGCEPTVQDSIVLIVDPEEEISSPAEIMTQLTNSIIQQSCKPPFGADTLDILETFLQRQTGNICLVVHYAGFSVNILRTHICNVMKIPLGFQKLFVADTLRKLKQLGNGQLVKAYSNFFNEKLPREDKMVSKFSSAPAFAAAILKLVCRVKCLLDHVLENQKKFVDFKLQQPKKRITQQECTDGLVQKTKRKRMQWTHELQNDLMKCYKKSNPSEKGYQQRLYALWLDMHPDNNVTQKTIINRVHKTVKRRLIYDNTPENESNVPHTHVQSELPQTSSFPSSLFDRSRTFKEVEITKVYQKKKFRSSKHH
ncbi:unnamed protein product [Clavelina lepadiformis]|uniref:Exonuclease domain-containing protein n=1 Tax=Clavelina lepadiformis TaxID=159417 RepID=A0ABP0GYX3_CLALP